MAFEDNRKVVKSKLHSAIIKSLTEAILTLQSRIQENARVGWSQTKGSYRSYVDEDNEKAYVGSPLENAIWEEFGTGDYAVKGGRKTPWYVPVDEYAGKKRPTYNGKVVIVYGKNGKRFYKTNGKKPNRTMQRAYEENKDILKAGMESQIAKYMED